MRVYLLDDHEIVRRGLSELLSTEEGIEVVDSGSAPGNTPHPGVAPGRRGPRPARRGNGGVDVCREIRSVDPTIKVII